MSRAAVAQVSFTRGSSIRCHFWRWWLKYSFAQVAQILVSTWLRFSLTFTEMPINEKKEKTCIVYDCNTSGGSQLLSIVKEINELNNNTEVKLTPPSSVYILFCVDKQPVEETGNKFKDHGLELYRYFDLDEDIKKQLHDLKEKCIKEKRQPDFYNKNDKKAALLIIDSIKKKSKYFF